MTGLKREIIFSFFRSFCRMVFFYAYLLPSALRSFPFLSFPFLLTIPSSSALYASLKILLSIVQYICKLTFWSPLLFLCLCRESDQLKHTIAGAGAGLVTSVVTCPLDVVKTRLQNQGVVSSKSKSYKGTAGKAKAQSKGYHRQYEGIYFYFLGIRLTSP